MNVEIAMVHWCESCDASLPRLRKSFLEVESVFNRVIPVYDHLLTQNIDLHMPICEDKYLRSRY